MLKKILILIGALMFAWTSGKSQTVNHDEAYEAANNCIRLRAEQNIFKISGSHNIKQSDKVLAYCFELDPRGYIVITSDIRLEPVIAYSFNSGFSVRGQEKNPLEEVLIYDLLQRHEHINLLDPDMLLSTAERWASLRDESHSTKAYEQWPPDGSTSTGGWLETNWKQSSPYNDLCPLDNVTGSRSVAGCPAVALAMIINYQKNLNGTRFDDGDDYYHNYAGRQYWIDDDNVLMDFPSFTRINAIFDSINYKYPMFIPLNSEEKAALVFACGVAAQQVYTSEVSGTFGVDQAYDAYLRFGYDHAMMLYDSDTSFYTHMKTNMKNGIPVHLALLVDGSGGGHNVVADGYNTDDYYHLNFGWGGSYNGWYLIPEGIPYNLTIVEGAVMDIGESHVGVSSDQPAENISLSVFPNPSNGSFNIEITIVEEQWVSISLYSQGGAFLANIYNGELEKGKQIIDCDVNQPTGIYYLTLKTNQKTYSNRVVIKN